MEITAWSESETRTFFKGAFSRVGMAVEERALGSLSHCAGGLPALAHEIGEAVFLVDGDGRIDDGDVLEGVARAAEIVGRKHLEPHVLSAIRSKHYRSILRRLPREPFGVRFQRRAVLESIPTEEGKAFDNFLRRMEELAVLVKEPDRGPGAYRFANLLHYLYFRLEAERRGHGSG